MKASIHYTMIKSLSQSNIQSAIAQLPEFLKNTIIGYKNQIDQLRVLGGKLLLHKCIEDWELKGELTLSNLKYSIYHRPYFEHPFAFSISHSGNYVVVAATTRSNIGIDIEQVQLVNMQEYRDFFTLQEWNCIYNENSFFRIWTRKEAILKALGTGFYQNLADIDVSVETFQFKDQHFLLHSIDIDKEYITSLALDQSITKFNLYPIEWKSLFS